MKLISRLIARKRIERRRAIDIGMENGHFGPAPQELFGHATTVLARCGLFAIETCEC